MGKYLDNRLKFHTASRVGAQTGYSLAQALDPDGHIVRHTAVWTAETSQFPKNVSTSTNPNVATADLVEQFAGVFDANGVLTTPVDGASLAREIKNDAGTVIGKVYRNTNFPAVELFYQVKMSGVASSDGGDSNGTYQAYEIKEGGKRVMDWVAPTAVIDPATGGPVAGFSGIPEANVSGTWTALADVGKWALSTGSWEFIPMAGILTFEPSVTPGDKDAASSIRFTGFKYIGETLDVAIEELEDRISGDIAGDYDGSMEDLNAAISAEAQTRADADTALAGRATTLEGLVATINGDAETAGSIAKAEADAKAYTDAREVVLQGNIDGKVDKNGTDRLMTAAEGTKLGTYPADYATVESAINAKVAQTDYDAAIAVRYTKTEAEAMVDGKITTALASVHEFKGQVADMAALAAVQNPKHGDVYNVLVSTNGTSAEYYWNKDANEGVGAWEEFGTTIDMTGYATKVYADNAVSVEQTRATGIEGGLRTDVDANTAAIAVINGSEAGSISAAVAAEASRATGIEGGLRTDVDAATAAITVLNGNDTTAGSVAKAVKDAVDAEAALARAAEAANASDIADNASDIADNAAAIALLNNNAETEGSVAYAVAAEAAIARAAEQANANAIGAEAETRANAVTTLDGKITAEQTRASGVESGLRTDVDANTAAIGVLNGNGEGSVAAAVAAEESRATGVESGLRTDVDANAADITILKGNATTAGSVAKSVKDAVDAEAALRTSGDQTNATAISNEVTRATGVEAGFETRIAANEAALSALGTVSGGSIADALSGKVDNSTYATDKAALEAADTALAGRMTTAEGAITTLNGDANTSGSVAKSVADAVAAEAAIARAAEQANATAITALQADTAACKAANSYEFVGVDTTKELSGKLYIVRGAKLTATLPSGDAVGQNFQARILVNEGASLLGGTITPTNGDTINGGSVLRLDSVMDVVLLYDRAAGDWFVLQTLF